MYLQGKNYTDFNEEKTAIVLRSMYFVPLYVAIRDRLISIVPFQFICKCQLKPTSESRCYLYS